MPLEINFVRLEYAYHKLRPHRYIHPGCVHGINVENKQQAKQWLQHACAEGNDDADIQQACVLALSILDG
jgi:hypothetical protein